jgi:hypothetical protein
VLDVEAALADPATEEDAALPEPEALEEEPVAVEEPEAEAGVAADNFSTPAVSTTGTTGNWLPDKLVVITVFVVIVVTPATAISRFTVTLHTAEVVPLISQVSEAEASKPMVSVWYS